MSRVEPDLCEQVGRLGGVDDTDALVARAERGADKRDEDGVSLGRAGVQRADVVARGGWLPYADVDGFTHPLTSFSGSTVIGSDLHVRTPQKGVAW